MVDVFLVSYTDRNGKVILDLHIGGNVRFMADGLQMLTETKVDNVFMHLSDKNYKNESKT